MLLTADVALVGEAGTGLGGWLAPAAEEGQPGTGRGPLPPGTRGVAVARGGGLLGRRWLLLLLLLVPGEAEKEA